jgi:hypothetical protein
MGAMRSPETLVRIPTTRRHISKDGDNALVSIYASFEVGAIFYCYKKTLKILDNFKCRSLAMNLIDIHKVFTVLKHAAGLTDMVFTLVPSFLCSCIM